MNNNSGLGQISLIYPSLKIKSKTKQKKKRKGHQTYR